jgi:hypothetical protein
MKKRFVGIFVAVLLAGAVPALALDFLGAPCAGLSRGQAEVGYSYTYNWMDVDISEGLYGNYAGSYVKFPKHLNLQKHYAVLGYGFSDNWEAYLMLGSAGGTSEVSTSAWGSKGIDMGNVFSIGFGTKATFFEQGNWKIGGIYQMSWLDGLHLSRSVWAVGEGAWLHSLKGELSLLEIQITAGPTTE